MKREQGFTLIELVMVIVIIGILAAVALPRFTNLRREAQRGACDGNQGAIKGALSAYYARTAVSPSFDSLNRAASGFPRSIATGTTFATCFIAGGTLPNCPVSANIYGSATYYASTGIVTTHPHP